jgi:hypothetical protein
MEAKFASYEPPGPTINARATKAIPADTRDLSPDGAASAQAACLGLSCFLLTVFAAAWLVTAGRLSRRPFAAIIHRSPATQWFSPQTSFRPPPVL